ncbi:hypothetical protein [Marinomonas posidonica]|uniref:hypothetical protein n=1 Tax=Marinomonas posidonica TaxID=936476 RepID=UPI003735DDF5
MFRTEFTSPSWTGTLIDMETGKALSGIKVTDLTSLNSTLTDSDGFFKLPATTQEFSFKLPAASMAKTYHMDISLEQRTLRFSGQHLAFDDQDPDFHLGFFPIETHYKNAPFMLGKDLQTALPIALIENCGVPLKNAISLSRAARLSQSLAEQKHSFGGLEVSQDQVSLTYYWASQAWENVSQQCFKQDYKQTVAFSTLHEMFFEEAYPYFEPLI